MASQQSLIVFSSHLERKRKFHLIVIALTNLSYTGWAQKHVALGWVPFWISLPSCGGKGAQRFCWWEKKYLYIMYIMSFIYKHIPISLGFWLLEVKECFCVHPIFKLIYLSMFVFLILRIYWALLSLADRAQITFSSYCSCVITHLCTE